MWNYLWLEAKPSDKMCHNIRLKLQALPSNTSNEVFPCFWTDLRSPRLSHLCETLAFWHNIIYRTSDTTPGFDPPPRPPRFHSLLLGENNWRLLWIGVLGFGLAPAVLAVAKTCFTEVLPLMQSLHNRATYVMTRCWTSPQSSKSYPNGKPFISLQNCNFTEHFFRKTATRCVLEKQWMQSLCIDRVPPQYGIAESYY